MARCRGTSRRREAWFRLGRAVRGRGVDVDGRDGRRRRRRRRRRAREFAQQRGVGVLHGEVLRAVRRAPLVEDVDGAEQPRAVAAERVRQERLRRDHGRVVGRVGVHVDVPAVRGLVLRVEEERDAELHRRVRVRGPEAPEALDVLADEVHVALADGDADVLLDEGVLVGQQVRLERELAHDMWELVSEYDYAGRRHYYQELARLCRTLNCRTYIEDPKTVLTS